MPILAITFVAGAMQSRIAREHLVRPDIKRPIFAWEMAGNREALNAIKLSWGNEGRTQARSTLLWDFPFLLAYGFGLALTCSLGAAAFVEFGWKPAAILMSTLGWAVLGAALFDLSENFLLWWSLSKTQTTDSVAVATRWIARAKFFLVFLAVAGSFLSVGIDLLGCRFGCDA